MKKSMLTPKIFDIPIGKKLKINIWVFPTIIASVYGGYTQLFFVSYLSAALHELAHIICAHFLKVGISYVNLYPFGISARLKSSYIQSAEKEFLVAIAGPFCSLLLFWLFSSLYAIYGQPLLLYSADTNLALSLINLIPVLPLDGGRILKALLTSRFGIIRSYNFMLKLSRIATLILLVSAIIFVITVQNFSLILISAFLLQNLVWEQHSLSLITLKEVLASKEKVNLKNILPAKVICVSEEALASSILKILSYDRFYLINTIDKNCKITKTLTESEVLSALTQTGIRIKFKDI